MKKLIIVCEEKLRRYGDFLAQLISGADDKDEVIVGIKDGSAAAKVWTEKEFSANSTTISSEQYILFIGDSKLIKEKRYHMQERFSEFGMNYGWLGKQAVLFVDHSLSFEEYEGFYNLIVAECKAGSQPEVRRLLTAEDEETSEQETAKEVERPRRRGLLKVLDSLESVGEAVKKTADAGMDTVNKIAKDINAAAKAKEIEDQQYTCLVLLFYLNDLALFLGADSE